MKIRNIIFNLLGMLVIVMFGYITYVLPQTAPTLIISGVMITLAMLAMYINHYIDNIKY
jgi:hypothetical protein